MVTVVPAEAGYGDIGQLFAQGATSGYQNRADEMALQKAIMGLGEKPTPRQILDAVTQTKTYSPESKQKLFKNYLGVQQFEELQKQHEATQAATKSKNEALAAKQAERNAILAEKNAIATRKETKEATKLAEDKARNVELSKIIADTPEEQERIANSFSTDALEKLASEKFKPTNQTPFEKTVSAEQAKDYFNLAKEVPKLRGQLKEIEDLEKEYSEIGLFGGANWTKPISQIVGTEKFQEIQKRSYTTMEPIVKLFNPSGPIATEKLNNIIETYTINKFDQPRTVRAKLEAIKRFTKQAFDRGNARIKLYEKYDGQVPIRELARFEEETNEIIDATMDLGLKEEGEAPSWAPDPTKLKGEELVNEAEGITYYSDGTKWIRKK